MLFPKTHTPRWIVFLIDLLISAASLILAFFLRFNFNIPETEVTKLEFTVTLGLFIRALTFIIFRSYAGLIRYTSAKDTERIFVVVISGSITLIALNLINYFFIAGVFLIPSSVIVIDFFIAYEKYYSHR